ncbi:MAG TPA: ABC transporter permease subunit [Candidatus Lustribacter sp.]|nr:ABC transporter permease subunit [Candidatus Lustribacter sp.]
MIAPGYARLLVVAGVLAVWEAGARLFGDPLFVCPPSDVLAALPPLFADPKIVHALVITVLEMVVAFALAAALGAAFGLTVGLGRFTRGALMPIVLLLYAIPQTTVLPLFVLTFGIGPEAKIAFGLSQGIFPVIVSTVAGVANLPPALLTAARSMGASRMQLLRTVVIPYMVPSFFTGLRLGMTAVLLGVLIAELYVSTAGLGYYTRHFAQSFSPPKLFALIAVLAAIAVVLNELCRIAERRFSRWQYA